MTQPIKKNKVTFKKKEIKKKKKKEYGTSKLETKFAKEFLDKLNIKYIYQYKAESIGRYYDFFCYEHNAIIECDGDYWHSKNVLYENMTPTQKRNKRVDKIKDHWALINGIPIIRVWESDINNHPEKVLKMLKEKLGGYKEELKINNNKKKRDFYKKS